MNVSIYRYCPLCGTKLEERLAFNQPRQVCPACGFVHFRDPKVAVIGMVTWQDRVLLIRRDVEPMKGYWALPGGYMDAGEMPQAALRRELLEEVHLDVEFNELVEIFPMVGRGTTSQGIVIAYRAALEADQPPQLECDDDACEAGWFRSGEIPADLAFESTQTLLALWRDELG